MSCNKTKKNSKSFLSSPQKSTQKNLHQQNIYFLHFILTWKVIIRAFYEWSKTTIQLFETNSQLSLEFFQMRWKGKPGYDFHFSIEFGKNNCFFLHIILPCVVGRVKFLCVTTIYSCQAIIFFDCSVSLIKIGQYLVKLIWIFVLRKLKLLAVN